MSSIFTASLLQLTCFFLLLQTVFSAPQNFYSTCSGSENFTSSDPYATNLDELLRHLSYETAFKGFSLGSKGIDQYKAYGLALCYNYVSPANCKSCVGAASKEIVKLCPYSKGAALWYDKCTLKYSNKDFFGKIDYLGYIMCSHENASDPISFKIQKTEFLSQLANNASSIPRMQMTGVVELAGSHKLYGAAQCSRDLLSSDCKECLGRSINEDGCDVALGGRLASGSCNIRFETYNFFNA
ncbi:Cysteine-rich repeat secretory protein 38 [Morella rubra]|uniref:Cysteine-rich repeat secretory protein 38 n=1 Tax=Morella rubra TaxID=262757 RepID=A0A6A1VCJ3_9ROSI|nr:Cysteine-rich repeat secretory protein 38 [Morella rubra]